MLWAIFILSIFSNGYLVKKRVSKNSTSVLPFSFFYGSIICVSLIFVGFFLLKNLTAVLLLYLLISGILFVRFNSGNLQINSNIIRDTAKFIALFLISYFLFAKSFSYSDSAFLVQSNLYQDFAAHIPFIRYFSTGENYIPEVLFYAGKNLYYHFMFDFYAGLLEFLGARIDVALNVISALSLTSLFFVIVRLSKFIFKDWHIGALACVILILNSDLSFINVIPKALSLSALYHHNAYPIGSLFNTVIDGNFLNINVLLNQRQIIFGLLSVFIILFLLLSMDIKRTSNQLFIGVLIGLMPFWHISALITLYILMIGYLVLVPNSRKSILKILLISTVLVLPQLILIKLGSASAIKFNPGFMVSGQLNLLSFLSFWIWNLGFSIPFAIYGYMNSNKFQRQIFLAFLLIFITPNIIQFASNMFDNHKFFNIWIVMWNMFVALGVLSICRKGVMGKVASILGIILLTVSGLLHLVVVKNDVYARIPDPVNSKLFDKIKDIKSTYVTNGEIYDPANLYGLKTFLGRPQYIYLYGGDPTLRITLKKDILNGKNNDQIKSVLKDENIRYIIIYKDGFAPNLIRANHKKLNQLYKKVYEDNSGFIYKI